MPDLLLFKFIGIPLFILIFIIENIMYLRKQNKPTFIYRLAFYSFIIYSLFTLKYTFFPFPIGNDAIMEYKILGLHNNFIPFKDVVSNDKFNAYPVLGNIALLLPLGIYVPLLFSKKEFKVNLTVGLMISVFIETMQFILSSLIGVTYRTTDINDIIFNGTGYVIGYFIFSFSDLLVSPLLKRKFKFLS
ncbi:VanZ family protein [Priestia aryabhattai]|uniref:VanZ family protein n=1 Tax=Priestia aryabhattai TaxID=412384 RepID=UPI0020402508|nr:VanZ family protein [Priestia aryabhattai]MCM2979048.1 VanZ family protein [Priestia aryabhattai]